MMTTRRSYWTHNGSAVACLALAVLTAAWPEWIEEIFGVSPDGGSGALEWMIVLVFATCATALHVAARRVQRLAEPNRVQGRW